MNKTFTYIFLVILILQTNMFAEKPPANRATGFFVAIGVFSRN